MPLPDAGKKTKAAINHSNTSSMTKDEKQAFLKRGGILIRSGFNAKGQPCIKWRTIKKDWYNTGLCESIEHADRLNDSLVSRHPEKFQIDQDN